MVGTAANQPLSRVKTVDSMRSMPPQPIYGNPTVIGDP